MADSPKASAERKNLLLAFFAPLVVTRARLAPLATELARPSHPAIGINPRPKPNNSSVTSPAVVLGSRSCSFLKPSNASVTGRAYSVPKERSRPAAANSAIPWATVTGATTSPRPMSVNVDSSYGARISRACFFNALADFTSPFSNAAIACPAINSCSC